MVVNRHSEDVASGLINDAETVAFALHDIDHRPGDGRATIVAACAVHKAGVGDWDDTSCFVAREKRDGRILPPIGEFDDLIRKVKSCRDEFKRIDLTVDSSSTS